MVENNMSEFNEVQEESSFNIYEIIFKYLVYWPWFVASVIICLVCAFIYMRYQVPVYSVTSSVLIKEDDPRSKMMTNTNGALAALQDMGGFSMTTTFDNEVEILKSRTLVRKAVVDLGLYINISQKRFFGYSTPLYKNSPVNVYLTPDEAEKLRGGVKLDMKYTTAGKLSVKAEYSIEKEKYELEQEFDSIPAVLPTPVGVFSFTHNEAVDSLAKDVELVAYVASPTAVAMSYASNLSVTPVSKATTIAKISVNNSNTKRGIDFINSLVENYNKDANNEKNEVARKSAEFIEDRLAIINTELGTTESELAAFKQRSGLTDLKADAELALKQNSQYEEQRIQNATQISLVEFLQNYINNPVNANEVIPANVGLQDANLTSVINQYNTMIIERNRLLRTSSESNPAVINMNTGIESMRKSVQTTVQSVLRGLQIAQTDIERQAKKFETRISDAPKQEKEFLTISRQQEIKASLYIMLLKKREENAITLAATANNGRIIETPLPGTAPVSPKKKMIALAALVLGLGIPVGVIFLRDLLKYKIESHEDVEKLTDVNILADIPQAKTEETGAIVVRENHNNIMEEMFRSLRTNLLFMLEKGEKVILFTSTMSGEGKSFVAGNLAASLAFLGKKTIIVGLDIRKPGLNKVFKLSRHAEGITNYLSSPDTVNLFDMVQHSDISANLDILPGGTVPPNPTELVTREVLDKAIAQLKERYDYVILDTAPIGMVTDTAIISRVADMGVYICRADFTPKAGFEYINALKREKKFPKLATVINGIDMSKRKHSYGYGYGKKYGYGKGYGYGYGYGFETENKNK